jgi:hypothetical protein
MIAATVVATPALAANPPIAIVGPAEWDLPTVPSANVFMQTGVFQDSTNTYNASGQEVSTASSQTYEGISRWAHLFSFKSTPNTGFFWEYLQPEVYVQLPNNQSASGLGDPMFDFGVYRNPTKSLTIGVQQILSIPIGQQQVTNHAWIYLPSIILDWHPTSGAAKNFALDGTFGAGVFSGLRGVTGAAAGHAPGALYYAETSVRYQMNSWLAPFVQNVYQTESSTNFFQSNHEDDIGAGLKINFTGARWLSIWYLTGASGANTGKTNALYFRFVNIF